MSFNPIQKAAVPSWAEKIDPLLKKMAERSGGRLDSDGLYAALANGDYWLAEIGNWRAAMVLNPVRWATGLNELEIACLAGDGMSEWEQAMFDAETLARDLRFHKLSIPRGRRGWRKICEARGWKETGVVLEKDLTQ